MTRSLLVLLLAVPAVAEPAAISATLEALRSQAASDPAAAGQEGASARAGKAFDGFTIETLAPVEYAVYAGEPRKSPPPKLDEPAPRKQAPAPAVKAPGPTDGENTDYYFEGKKPLDGITIYTPVKGNGTTNGGESPTDKYGKYGKYAVLGGLALLGVGLALGGTPLVALALIGGLLIGAGAVLSFLFGKKK